MFQPLEGDLDLLHIDVAVHHAIEKRPNQRRRVHEQDVTKIQWWKARGPYCFSSGINTEENVAALPLPPSPSLGSHWEQHVVHMSEADLRTSKSGSCCVMMYLK